MQSDSALRDAIRRLSAGESLGVEDTSTAFDVIMRGEATPAQIAALLVALRVKGETPEEVAGGAQALRGAMVRLACDDPGSLVDTCGTGGGTVSTFNISTAAALVVAAAGVRVAKHGNRSFTSQSGSADVLEALGVTIEVSADTMASALRVAGVVFMFAPRMHPAMRHVGPVRRELAIPTMMNIVGPLANPAQAGRQVIGVADERRMELIAGAVATLGTVHTLVVHGAPGLDEVSPLGATRVIEVKGNTIGEWEIRPERYDLSARSADELAGGSPAVNASIVRDVLSGARRDGARKAVLLNAAAGLLVGGAGNYEVALSRAAEVLDSGAAVETLERLRAAMRDTA